MNKKLKEAKTAREKNKKKIAQIYKLVKTSNFSRQDIIDFLKDVLPKAWSESINTYMISAPFSDVQSLFVDILFLAIHDSEKKIIVHTSN